MFRKVSRPGTGPTISKDELLARISQGDVSLVDVRPLAAYNGWRLDGEARGGHIPGAVALPDELARPTR